MKIFDLYNWKCEQNSFSIRPSAGKDAKAYTIDIQPLESKTPMQRLSQEAVLPQGEESLTSDLSTIEGKEVKPETEEDAEAVTDAEDDEVSQKNPVIERLRISEDSMTSTTVEQLEPKANPVSEVLRKQSPESDAGDAFVQGLLNVAERKQSDAGAFIQNLPGVTPKRKPSDTTNDFLKGLLLTTGQRKPSAAKTGQNNKSDGNSIQGNDWLEID